MTSFPLRWCGKPFWSGGVVIIFTDALGIMPALPVAGRADRALPRTHTIPSDDGIRFTLAELPTELVQSENQSLALAFYCELTFVHPI